MSGLERIPAELRGRPQWVLWRSERRDGKLTKVPYSAQGGRASVDDPGTWASFENVELLAPTYDGIGFVFTADDPYAGLDYDDCLDGTRLHPNVAGHLLILDSYTEISPSGTGVKVIVRASKNGVGRCRTSKTSWGGEFEVYDKQRFFALTGLLLRGSPATIAPRQTQLNAILRAAFPKPQPKPEALPPGQPSLILDDRELIEKASAASNGDKFRALWNGDTSGYGSHSEADLALCDLLSFYTGRDFDRIDRLFRASGLMRDKWLRDDYRASTLYTATANTREIYTGSNGLGDSAGRLPPLPEPRTTPAPASQAEPFRLVVRTAREVLALPEPPEGDLLLGPLIVRGARTIIVGDTGHGKTTLAAQMIAAVLTGADVFGYQGAAVGPVLVLDIEQGVRSIKRTLRDAGIDSRDDVLYVSAPDGLSLDTDEEHRAEVERIVAENRPVVVVLDPYYKAHRGDSNEERAVVDLMRYLDALRTEHGFALLLPAHPRKDQSSTGARRLTLHDVAGSGAVTRGAEIVLAVERLSHGYARLRFLKDRDFDLPVGEAWPLIFTRGDGFKLDPKEEQKAEDLERRILDADAAWRTKKEWATYLGVGEKKAQDLLDALAETRQVEYEKGPEGRSDKAMCWRTALKPQRSATQSPKTEVLQGTALTAPTSIEDVGVNAVPNLRRESVSAPTQSPPIGDTEIDRLEALRQEMGL